MSSLPISPPTARAGTALPKSVGASPPTGAGGDFAALLTQSTARTAHAEGPKTRPQDTRRDTASRPDRDDDQVKDATASKPEADDAAPTKTSSPDERQPAADARDQASATPTADPNAAAQAQQPLAPTTPTTPATGGGAGATAGPSGLGPDGLPLDPQAVLAQQAPGADGPGAAGAADGKLQLPPELLDAKGQAHAGGHPGKDSNQHGGAQQGLPPAPTLPPTADAAAAASSNAPAGADAPTAAAPPAQPAPTVAQAQPAATALTQVPTASGAQQLTRASVVQTAERVQELVRIAATRSGQARATLQLKPEALGQVDVHLRTTRDGLVATIAAHDQAGLDALQQAGNELRRLLEDRGVQLQSLDLQLGAGQDGGFANQGDAGQARSGSSGAASSYGLSDDDDEVVAQDELTITDAPLTATSTLVDVTA
ncbi:MAG TPA: flagellar hook-length control protein FliK [Baekduia sp.]|uniref:flagellar hook-length control protein FliK n=1 Tax=Baekduia sp. TaxID=2600305 RepID=UPI002D797AB0|nr:flagellar hook-length control protein FliK [Baekduia sp.]HET6508864.1 flagellar hook-length control protein FliK [Baekduia sp.]